MDARMMNSLSLVLGVAALLGSVTLHAADSCSLAKARLEEYLVRLPQACSNSADCDGYYYRADACSPAVVLAKPGVTTSSEQRLLLLQGDVRQACASELGTHGVCSPIPYRAVCRKARCVDAVSAPGRSHARHTPASGRYASLSLRDSRADLRALGWSCARRRAEQHSRVRAAEGSLYPDLTLA